jgi:hypothetical protein
MFGKKPITPIWLSAICSIALFSATPVRAQALEILNPPIQVKAARKAHKKKTGSGNKTRFDSGSQETVKDRDKRLYRECRGAANAGACSGYTR